MGKAGRTLKTPKAKIEGLAIKTLQDALWFGKDYPKYMYKYSMSKELMMLFKLLVAKPDYWQNGLMYDVSVYDKLHQVFGTDYRHIFTYEVMEDFVLNVGELVYLEPLPEGQTPHKVRRLYKGDTVLIRVDKRDEELKADLQVLTCGLFQDTSDDFRNFRIDTSDVASFRKYLKLVDKDTQEEENFI